MILPIIVVFAYFASSVHGRKLYEHMTKEEIESVFNVKHDSIHRIGYEIIRVQLLTDRDVYMKSSSQEYRLYLNDNNVFLGSETPIFYTKYNTNGKLDVNKTFYKDYFPESLKLYHDYKNQAAFAVHTDENNNRHFDGVIGDLHIRSIPARLHKELERNHSAFSEMSPNNITNLSQNAFMNNSTYHIIIDKSNNSMHDVRNNKEQETKIHPLVHTYETTEHTVYPQLWIGIDYKTLELHGRDIKKIAKYVAAFWNAVDLRYRELTDPKVRLNIAGLTILETPVRKYNITDLPGYYNNSERIPIDSYDVVVTMTTEEPQYFEEIKQNETGLAYPGRACNYANRDAFVQDDGSFGFIKTAARVLGYFLGAEDDPDRYSDACGSNMGYIMSSEFKSHKSFRWSKCSKEAMKAFFNSDGANCLKNKPYGGSQYPKILPGTLLSRDEQCLRLFGVHAESSETYEADCEILWCQPENVWTIFGFSFRAGASQTSFLVPEGTSCGMNRICLDGYCVEDSPSYHSANSQWNQ